MQIELRSDASPGGEIEATILGAGMSGIYNFRIFEKYGNVGGTWRDMKRVNFDEYEDVK